MLRRALLYSLLLPVYTVECMYEYSLCLLLYDVTVLVGADPTTVQEI
jgi:hypothetical protein